MKKLDLTLSQDRDWLQGLREQDFARGELQASVGAILDRVRREGDAAVRAFTLQYDGVNREGIRLSDAELRDLALACPPDLVQVFERAASRIRAFHQPQLPRGYVLDHGRLEHRVVPLEAVGLYVPGGRAAYPSTVLMNAIPAQMAGVARRCVATPPQASGPIVSPAVAAACRVAGVTDVFLMGGAQAVGALAFGTATVPRVQKICGPGNAWVAEAKRQVAGRVGIDMWAGPSELMVLDDGRVPAERIAYDLLAQAEHDPLAITLCVTTSRSTWNDLPGAVDGVLAREPNPVAAQSTSSRSAVVWAPDLQGAVDFVNTFAPEHLQILASPELAERITGAGAIFVGDDTPEPVGDYFAGPNHTLPTAGTAAFSSALGVYDFVKRVNVVRWTSDELQRHGADIALFARAEGLIAHARAVEVRLAEKAGAPDAPLDPAEYVLPAVRRQRAYQLLAPAIAPIKLNQNEAPEDLPDTVKRRLLDRFARADWRRYPPFEPTALRTLLAKRDGWLPEGVLVGNGSNELLTLLIRSLVGPGDVVVRPDPCFSLYPLHLDVAGASQRPLALLESRDFAYEENALLEASVGAKVVLLTSPNNPTGSVLARETLERLLERRAALVIVDEAYREWCGQDFAPLLGPEVPLVLLRTCSKAQALAGLRFGYLLGPPSLCAELEKVILPYAVNTLTQIAAEELLTQSALLTARVSQVIAERSRMAKLLRAKDRKVIEGGANFVLLSSANPAADFKRLLAGGVLVRDLSHAVPGYLRVSVGTASDTDRLVELL